jgi:hypothetical protein
VIPPRKAANAGSSTWSSPRYTAMERPRRRLSCCLTAAPLSPSSLGRISQTFLPHSIRKCFEQSDLEPRQKATQITYSVLGQRASSSFPSVQAEITNPRNANPIAHVRLPSPADNPDAEAWASGQRG